MLKLKTRYLKRQWI